MRLTVLRRIEVSAYVSFIRLLTFLWHNSLSARRVYEIPFTPPVWKAGHRSTSVSLLTTFDFTYSSKMEPRPIILHIYEAQCNLSSLDVISPTNLQPMRDRFLRLINSRRLTCMIIVVPVIVYILTLSSNSRSYNRAP